LHISKQNNSAEAKTNFTLIAGLIDHYMQNYADRKFLDIIEEDEGPQKLTLGQLAIGFEATLLFLAATFFVCEILWFNLKKLFVKIVN